VPKIIIYVLYLRHFFQYMADCVSACVVCIMRTLVSSGSKHLLLVLLLGYLLLCDLRKTDSFYIITTAIVT